MRLALPTRTPQAPFPLGLSRDCMPFKGFRALEKVKSLKSFLEAVASKPHEPSQNPEHEPGTCRLKTGNVTCD